MQKKETIVLKFPKINHQKIALIIIILITGPVFYAADMYTDIYYSLSTISEETLPSLFGILLGLKNIIMGGLIFAGPAFIFLFTKEFKRNTASLMLLYVILLIIILISTTNDNGFAFLEALLYTTPLLIGISIFLLTLRKK